MKLIKVRVLRGFCIGAGHDLLPGDEIKMTEAEYRLRKSQGRVEEVAEEKAKPPAEGETLKEPTAEAPTGKDERVKRTQRGGMI